MIYADVHVVTAESNRFETILDDDRVEYAELNHSIKEKNKRAQRNMVTSEDYGNSSTLCYNIIAT